MPIAATRFKFLDKDTNLPIADISKINDNNSYGVKTGIPEFDTMLNGVNQAGITTLTKLTTDVTDKIQLATDAVLMSDELKTAEDFINDKISYLNNLKLPPIAQDILSTISLIDKIALGGFLKDKYGLGKLGLCSMNFNLKLKLPNIKLKFDIDVGNLLKLKLDLFDRECFPSLKGSDVGTLLGSSEGKKKLLDISNPIKPKQDEDIEKAFADFKLYSRDLEEKNKVEPDIPVEDDFITTTMVLPMSQIATKVQELDSLDTEEKEDMLADIESELVTQSANYEVYSKLLIMKGEISKLPIVSPDVSSKEHKYSNVNARMAELASSVAQPKMRDKSLSPKFDSTEIDTEALNAFNTFKSNALTLGYGNLTTIDSGKYTDEDIAALLPSTSAELKANLEENKTESNAHRWRDDISCTSQTFVEDNGWTVG